MGFDSFPYPPLEIAYCSIVPGEFGSSSCEDIALYTFKTTLK